MPGEDKSVQIYPSKRQKLRKTNFTSSRGSESALKPRMGSTKVRKTARTDIVNKHELFPCSRLLSLTHQHHINKTATELLRYHRTVCWLCGD